MEHEVRNIGLRQAKVLCRMSYDERLKFLAEGLPIIQESADGYWKASLQLKEFPREAEVLRGHAVEEAAKALIVLDAVRCPRKLISQNMGKIVGWFYDHLARLIYVEVIGWRPSHVMELRENVRPLRESHSVEGEVGEFIFPNWSLYMRESQLYADVACEDGKEPYWSAPFPIDIRISTLAPPILRLTYAMSALGMFSLEGVRTISEIWSTTTFSSYEDPQMALSLTRRLLNRLIEKNIPTQSATNEHIKTLYDLWQLPMYDFDLELINIPLAELKEEQKRILFTEMGLP